MTTPKARQPKGTRTGGQFAASAHQEAAVQLTEEEQRRQERERPLTLAEVEYMQRNYGTYDFDHPGMPKVFEAALEKASDTDEGRLVLRRRAEAEKLAQYTGIPAAEIQGFYDEVKDLEPMSEGWENLVQTWSQYIWNRPRGEVVHIADQMRKVHGKPVLEELVAQRDAMTAQIDAHRLNDAANAIRQKHPGALWLEVRNGAGSGDSGVILWDRDDNELWLGDSGQFPELSAFDLVPMNYDAEKSALRTCAEPGGDLYRRTYNLDRMAAVTANDLLQS